MLIAKEKRHSNVSEYILYMWQIEDLIRAFKLDVDAVIENVFSSSTSDKSLLDDYKKWYLDIIEMMTLENIKEKGHLQVVMNLVIDLNQFHIEILNSNEEIKYRELYQKAAPYIVEFKSKLKSDIKNEVEIIFNALYALLLMRIQKKEISEATNEAMGAFSQLLAFLTKKYHEREQKEKTEWM